jgi:hypothetical protein
LPDWPLHVRDQVEKHRRMKRDETEEGFCHDYRGDDIFQTQAQFLRESLR